MTAIAKTRAKDPRLIAAQVVKNTLGNIANWLGEGASVVLHRDGIVATVYHRCAEARERRKTSQKNTFKEVFLGVRFINLSSDQLDRAGIKKCTCAFLKTAGTHVKIPQENSFYVMPSVVYDTSCY